jgi:TP901 family phage tail tape measure protein
LGTATTKWILELVDRAAGPAKQIASALEGVTQTAEEATEHLRHLEERGAGLNKQFRNLTIGVAAFAALSYGSLQFEQSMAAANTMAGSGTESLKRYTTQVEDLSKKVPKLQTELADGLYATLSAGVPQNNAIQFLEDSSRAAVGGLAEIGTVVNTTSALIKNYGDAWESAGAIQDKLQKTVNLGTIAGLEELGNALPRVSTLASQLNMTQSELLATFATASGVTGNASEVATQLNAALASMMKPSAEAISMAENLGIAFDATSITKAGGLGNYIQELMPRIQAFADKTGSTQEEIVGKLFGSQEAIKLVMGLGGKLADSFAQNTVSIENSTGAVEVAFKAMSETTLAQTTLARSEFTTMMNEIMRALDPVISVVIRLVKGVFQLVQMFMQSNPVLSRVIIIATALGVAVYGAGLAVAIFGNRLAIANAKGTGFLLTSIKMIANLTGQIIGYGILGAVMVGQFVGGLIASTASMIGLNVAMYANPIGIIVLGIIATIAAIALVITYWDDLKGYLIQFGEFFYKYSPFGFLIELIEKIFPGLKAAVSDAFSSVMDWLSEMWSYVTDIFDKITDFLGFGGDTDINLNTKNTVETLASGGDAAALDGIFTGGVKGGKTSGGGKGSSASGGGSGKSVSMTLNITNNFNVAAGRMREQAKEAAEIVIREINDQLRDEVITLG